MNKYKVCYKRFLKDKSWLTISNFLTVIRIALTPLIVVGISYERWFAVFIIFIIVGITDLLDGYIARSFNQATELGKILDPLADKFLIISMFFSLAFLKSPSFSIPRWFVFFVVLREAIIITGTFLLLRIKEQLEVQPTIWGKLTTLFQLMFIFWLFICHFLGWAPVKTYYILIILLTMFSLISLFHYIKVGFKSLR